MAGESYWQVGCDDAKAGRDRDAKLRRRAGYEQGYRAGRGGPTEYSLLPFPVITDPFNHDEDDSYPEDEVICPHCGKDY
jgi:hypothetical protein